MDKTLLILAAGLGTRYGKLKQFDRIGPSGEFIIDYSVYDAIKANFNKVVFVIRKMIEKEFKASIANKFVDKIEVDYIYQEIDNIPTNISFSKDRQKPWGTGHALLTAASKINESFAVINADDFYGAESYNILSKFISEFDGKNETDYYMIGYKLKNTLSDFGTVARGICDVDNKDYLLSITERTKIMKNKGVIAYLDDAENWIPLNDNTLVSMNMYGFTPSIFDFYENYFSEFMAKFNNDIKAEFFLPTVLSQLCEKKKIQIQALTTNEKWFGLTYHKDKIIAKSKILNLIKSGKYSQKLWE